VRTTLTLDDDLAMALHDRAVEQGRPLKDVVNEALRLGLAAVDERPRITFRTHDTGIDPAFDLTKASTLAARLEDEAIVEALNGPSAS
jgi:plasmid stability protein